MGDSHLYALPIKAGGWEGEGGDGRKRQFIAHALEI